VAWLVGDELEHHQAQVAVIEYPAAPAAASAFVGATFVGVAIVTPAAVTAAFMAPAVVAAASAAVHPAVPAVMIPAVMVMVVAGIRGAVPRRVGEAPRLVSAVVVSGVFVS
jgi:hypothetical protein